MICYEPAVGLNSYWASTIASKLYSILYTYLYLLELLTRKSSIFLFNDRPA